MTRNELILRDYVAGETVAKLAKRYGVSPRRVYSIAERTAKRLGTPTRRKRTDDPRVALAAALYAAGRSTLEEAAVALDCCRQTAARLFRTLNASPPKKRRPSDSPDLDMSCPGNLFERVYHAYVRDSAKAVAQRFGLRSATVRKYAARWARYAGLPGKRSVAQAEAEKTRGEAESRQESPAA